MRASAARSLVLLARSRSVASHAAWRRPVPGFRRRCLAVPQLLGQRGTAAAEAYGSGTLPLPPAHALEEHSASDLAVDELGLTEAIKALRARGGTGETDLAELQPLAERSLSLASGASFKEIADLGEAFAAARLRLPLRDLMAKVSEKLREEHNPAFLPDAVRLLTATGRGNLFHVDLFEFVGDHITKLSAADLATFVYEGGRHGLRCRHLVEHAVGPAAELCQQMRLIDVMRAWQGFVRFSRDWKAFYIAALPTVKRELRVLEVPHLVLALRVARDLQSLRDFVDLHAACATELMVKLDTLSLSDMAQCLIFCSFSPKYRAQAQGLVRSVEQRWARTEDLTPLRVVEIVDALETFASWGMKPMQLVDRLEQILVDRQVELKYTGNVSLWISATQALAKMEHMGAKWTQVAIEFARDRFFVEKVSFFQQCSLIGALGRLRVYDEATYDNVAELLLSDLTLFKQVRDVAPVLWSYAIANCFHQRLFDSTYDLMIEWFEGEKLDVSSDAVHRAIIQAVWSFAVAGYHTRYESFAAFLDYALFREDDLRVAHVRRMGQLADAVLTEAPHLASLCQYPEKLEAARSGPRVRKLVSSDPSAEPAVLKELKDALHHLGWPYEEQYMPDNQSAFYLDISLHQKTGQKVGFLMAGAFERLSVGLPGETQERRESGLFALARRLLAHRGWRTAVIDRSSWAGLSGMEQQCAFLEDTLQRLLAEPLPASSIGTASAAGAASAVGEVQV